MIQRTIVFKKHINLLVFGIVFGVIGVILVGLQVAPDVFYDQWIWKYYWGPVVADAAGHSVSWHGVSANEGYTLVSEITYGLILISALYGLYQLLKKLRITIDWYFCLALLPYILFGPVTRVLEDAEYFYEPSTYWFISPLIYVQTTVYALMFLLLGYYLENKTNTPSQKKTLVSLLVVFVAIDLVYTLLWLFEVPYGASRIEPWVFYLLSLIAFFPILYRGIHHKMVTSNTVIFSGGLLILLPCLFLVGRWIAGDQWSFSYGVRFDILFLIVGLVSLISVVVYGFAYVFRNNKTMALYKAPLNIAMLMGHMIDGLTSYISIYDPLHMGLPIYLEKHPASNTLMVIWPPLFPIVKFLLIILVIYLFDVLYKKELQHHLRLVNLLKIGIFILGVSPGLRDLLRVVMGV